MRVSVFRVYKEALGTCQSQHFCALAQPRLNCTCTYILFNLPRKEIALLVLIMLSSQRPHVTSAIQTRERAVVEP